MQDSRLTKLTFLICHILTVLSKFLLSTVLLLDLKLVITVETQPKLLRTVLCLDLTYSHQFLAFSIESTLKLRMVLKEQRAVKGGSLAELSLISCFTQGETVLSLMDVGTNLSLERLLVSLEAMSDLWSLVPHLLMVLSLTSSKLHSAAPSWKDMAWLKLQVDLLWPFLKIQFVVMLVVHCHVLSGDSRILKPWTTHLKTSLTPVVSF